MINQDVALELKNLGTLLMFYYEALHNRERFIDKGVMFFCANEIKLR